MKNITVLVTGGSGFLGIHTIAQLLQHGYTVRTTIRSLARQTDITDALTKAGTTDTADLSFFEADLNADPGWQEAVNGCDYVLHVASPFPLEQPADENDLIIPAREGTLRVLAAAAKAGVKRVVLTSSFAAIGYGEKKPGHIYTETDWTDEHAAIMPYIKSKTVAEKAAWQFMENDGGKTELTVINPVGIFGPTMGSILSASIKGVILPIIEGKVTETPAFTFGVVDVRDVAALHLLAMTHPDAAGQRFIASSDNPMSFSDIASLITAERPEKSEKIIPLKPLPDADYVGISHAKAVRLLDWHPRQAAEAILASVDSL